MSESPDKFQQITPKDRDLIRFVIDKAKKYDEKEIFLRAQEQVPSLSQENVLDLYLRYHRFLFPLITNKSSNECKDLYRSDKKPKEVGKKIVGPHTSSSLDDSGLIPLEEETIPIIRQSSMPTVKNDTHGIKDSAPEELSEKQKSRSVDESSLQGPRKQKKGSRKAH